METQAKYDAWIQQAQISIAQQQVGYQGQVQAVIANYQAAYERARLFSDATARIQQDYSRQVMAQRRQQLDSSSGLVNLAQLGADLFRPFDPKISENLQTYADDTSARLRERLDNSIQQGVTVSVEGWDMPSIRGRIRLVTCAIYTRVQPDRKLQVLNSLRYTESRSSQMTQSVAEDWARRSKFLPYRKRIRLN